MTDRQPWHCPKCGSRGTTRPEVVVVFHRCVVVARTRRRVPMPEVEVDRESMRNQIWDGFAEALDARDADWILRPLDVTA